MAGPLQVGDVVNLARLAWDIYQYGWSDDHNATRQYLEFGRDVRALACSLRILNDIVTEADSSLRQQGINGSVRWDHLSLLEIIGDYEGTLGECRELLQANARYRVGTNAFRNLEWNALVQPTADRLRQRITLHNSKINHVLKPFEIDLLSRVRQDVLRLQQEMHYMHYDLASRINAVHINVQKLMGVTIPDLDEALRQQTQRATVLLDVPMDIAEQFRVSAITTYVDYRAEEDFELEDLSDAFILNWDKGTIHFEAGVLVADREPPVDQFINLLKCVWLFNRFQNSPRLQTADPSASHWPSYVRQLEDDLSSQCSRFGSELVKPEIAKATIRRDMFSIWPEKDPAPLVDVVTQDEMMEQLLEVPLQSSSSTVEQSAKLLRRLGSEGQRFRVMIAGTEQTAAGRPRQQVEVIDFDITSARLNPQYALPRGGGIVKEIILRRDERIAKMSFQSMSHLLKFQQAVTGWKAWGSYIQYNALVMFVLGGRKDPLVEQASIQLWIPKQTEGSLVTNSDAAATTTNGMPAPSRNGSIATSYLGSSPPQPPQPSRSMAPPNILPGTNLFNNNPRASQGRHPSLPTIPQRQSTNSSAFSSSWPRQSSPDPIGGPSPTDRQNFFPGPPRQAPPRKPVGQTPSPRRSGTLFPVPSHSTNGRSHSVSSAISTAAVSTSSNSSSSDVRSVSISTGTNTTGFLHQKPPKPMLVIFTENPQDGKFSFVTVKIDEDTNIEPERCNCRRSDKDGTSCAVAAIERQKGGSNLDARRYEPSSSGQDLDWNIARLALNNPASTSKDTNLPNLRRLSIAFPDSHARAIFGGTPNKCHCKVKNEGELKKCLRDGHRGLWGEVQEFYRKQGHNFHKERYERQQQVVNGLMGR